VFSELVVSREKDNYISRSERGTSAIGKTTGVGNRMKEAVNDWRMEIRGAIRGKEGENSP